MRLPERGAHRLEVRRGREDDAPLHHVVGDERMQRAGGGGAEDVWRGRGGVRKALLQQRVDGVAPRAKMNQQRTRRFKAAKESADKKAEAAALRSELKSTGRTPPPPSEKASFDTNVITPGTEFMARLATWLRYYVQLRLHGSAGWAQGACTCARPRLGSARHLLDQPIYMRMICFTKYYV